MNDRTNDLPTSKTTEPTTHMHTLNELLTVGRRRLSLLVWDDSRRRFFRMNDLAQIFAALVILSAICGLVLAAAKTLRQYVQRCEDRKADAVSEADAQATYEALSREIERTARDIAKQCEGRR